VICLSYYGIQCEPLFVIWFMFIHHINYNILVDWSSTTEQMCLAQRTVASNFSAEINTVLVIKITQLLHIAVALLTQTISTK